MNCLSLLDGATVFRLRAGAVECDEEGPRVAGVCLLEKNQDTMARERWRVPPLPAVESRLRRAYERRIDAAHKLGALRVVAEALNDGELARAQIAALLLRLPDPPAAAERSTVGLGLDKALHNNGWLLKDWDPEAHPRTGVAPNPGWFAPKDTDSEPSRKPSGVQAPTLDNRGAVTDASYDYQVAQVDGGVITPQPDDPAAVRRKIADIAQSWVGSKTWADAAYYNFLYGAGTNKCFLFVRDVLDAAGADPGTPNWLHGLPRPPLAGQWGDPDFEIPGWVVLKDGESLAPGDVVAQQLGYTDASGHVMIVGDDNTFVGTGDPPGQPGGTTEQIPARDFLGPPARQNDPNFWRGPLIYRRWIGQ